MRIPARTTFRRRSGVYWVGEAPDRAGLRRAARDAGWDFAAVDGRAVASKGELLDGLARALRFPRGFGRNWDALEDFLCDLAWLEGAGTLVLWSPVDALARKDPAALSSAVNVLRAAATWWRGEGRPFVVLLGGRRSRAGTGGRRP